MQAKLEARKFRARLRWPPCKRRQASVPDLGQAAAASVASAASASAANAISRITCILDDMMLWGTRDGRASNCETAQEKTRGFLGRNI